MVTLSDVLIAPSWPLTAVMLENGNDSPVCIAHTRWGEPCLTGAHRYDSPTKNCKIVRDHDCAKTLRDFHNGEISREECEWLLAEAVARGSKVEEVPFNAEIF